MQSFASLEDGISSLSYSGRSQLLCACWDGCARVYEVDSPESHPKVVRRERALLCASLCQGQIACGSIDGEVFAVDRVVGRHEAGVRCMEWLETGALFTGGWDGEVRRWDVRAKESKDSAHCGGKVFAMSSCGHSLVVGTSDRIVHTFDVRHLGEPVRRKESPLERQTRDLAAFGPDSYVVSSIDGKIAVESPETTFSFKCHRREGTAYPVNCVVSRPGDAESFASGGADGRVNYWDPLNKRRLPCSPDHQFPSSITALAFNEDGSKIAIASSHAFELQGGDIIPPLAPPNQIFIL